jgi:hypothetical protein
LLLVPLFLVLQQVELLVQLVQLVQLVLELLPVVV